MVPSTVLNHDDFVNNPNVAILAGAVNDAKRAADDALANRHNMSIVDWSYVVIAAPSFLWTAIEPEPCDEGITDCGPPYDRRGWHHALLLRMAGAVHRNGFRRHFVNDSQLIMQSHAHTWPSPIAPAGYAAFWDPRFTSGGNSTANRPATFYPQFEGQSAIVVELNNAILSIWAQRQRMVFTPWSTWAHGNVVDEALWEQASMSIRKLNDSMVHSRRQPLRVYLIGDAWSQHEVDSFETYLRDRGHTSMSVDFRGVFAASKGAASAAREMLDAYGNFQARRHSVSKSEL